MIGEDSYYFNYYRPWGRSNQMDIDFIDSVKKKGYTYITEDRMTKDAYGNAKKADPSLVEMTEIALSRLENENGFFVMIEGSDIDTYSHKSDISNMLNELFCFDDAVKVAMDYVDRYPDTLLVITADHETGGLSLNNITLKEQLTNNLFINGSNGYYSRYHSHTNANVLVYAYGAYVSELVNKGTIENTEIHDFVKSKLILIYES